MSPRLMHHTWPRALALAACVLVAGGAAPVAQAGRSCSAQPPSVAEVQQGMALAQRTAQRLDASGAQVLLLARAGQDLSRHGLAWSHLGFAYRATGPNGQPVWRVAHKLNQCGTAQAALYRQGLGEFFMDKPWRYQAAFAVPTPALQAQLLPLLQDNARLPQWHTPAYSLVAYPWATRYQQSNQWVIETLAGAADPGASNRERAQAWLRLHGYQPTELHISPLTRLGARVGQANVAFDDHPAALRYSDRIQTVSADSVFAWLPRAGLGGPMQTLY